jgi:hypothetical protein
VKNYFTAFKFVWLRALGYVLVPAVTLFLSKTETWSGETWSNATDFEKVRLFITCGLPGITALMALIDQSMARASATHDGLKAHTEFLNREK